MKYLSQKNTPKDIKNFVWYTRVSRDTSSYSISFDGYIKKVVKSDEADVIIKDGFIEIHNPKVFCSQFIPNKTVKKTLMNWAKNLKHISWSIKGKIKGHNKQYVETLLKNNQRTVGSGNEGYIESKNSYLIKTIVNEQSSKNNVRFDKHKLSKKMVIPMSGLWLPKVTSYNGDCITYVDDIYPLYRDLTIQDFSKMFIEMLKDGFTLKDLKLDNLALRNDRLIFNDMGKSISKFNPLLSENIEWTKSILRAAFYIFEHQHSYKALKSKNQSYNDIELINDKQFQFFQRDILVKSNVATTPVKKITIKIIKCLYDAIHNNRTFMDKKIPPIGAVLFSGNEIIDFARNAKTSKRYRKKGVRDDHAEAILLNRNQDTKNKHLSLFTTISPCREYCKGLLSQNQNIKEIIFLVSKPGIDNEFSLPGKQLFIAGRTNLDEKSKTMVTKMTKDFKKFFGKMKNCW